MKHVCPVASCAKDVPHYMFMCARHWRMVPKPLQAAVYESYRRDGRAGENHREAIRVVNAAEGGRAALQLPAGMKALTIWQPWASLVILGAKPHEFRRWNFADKPHLAPLIGQRIVIHAGARALRVSELIDLLDRIHAGDSALDVSIARPFVGMLLEALRLKECRIPLSAALGTAVLGNPRNVVDLFRDQADSDRLDEHMYGWPLTDVIAFDQPLPAAGAQGFWSWS
jgi:hypothetical protein